MTTRVLGRVLTFGSLVIGSVPLCAQERPAEPQRHRAGDVVIERQTLTSPTGDKIEYELGTIYVPENRASLTSRIIGVGFARFRALSPTTAPPIFTLPGGPGGSYLPRLPQMIALLGFLRRAADVVFVDQRGYSTRGDVLLFTGRYPAAPLDQPASLARSTAAEMDVAREAVTNATAKGIDLAGYTVLECADDVNDLRRALGYQQISLNGTSFGSQWSFAVMRRHPSIVARAILSGVEPLDYGYDAPSTVLAAVRRMASVVDQDSLFKPYLPSGGLMAAARAVIVRLEKEPVRVEITDSATGKPATVVLGPEDFRMSFPTGGRGFAKTILELYYGRYTRWATDIARRRRGGERPFPLIGPLIDGSLGVTPARLARLRGDSAIAFLGQWNFDAYLATADIWPSADVGDSIRTPITNPIPVVFAQGDWDTSTPLENTLDIAPFFPNRHVLVARHGGHGVFPPIAQHAPEIMDKIVEFLRTGSMTGIPTQIDLPIPTFDRPDFPPPDRPASQ